MTLDDDGYLTVYETQRPGRGGVQSGEAPVCVCGSERPACSSWEPAIAIGDTCVYCAHTFACHAAR